MIKKIIVIVLSISCLIVIYANPYEYLHLSLLLKQVETFLSTLYEKNYPQKITAWHESAKNRQPSDKPQAFITPYPVFIEYLEKYITMQKKFLNDTECLNDKDITTLINKMINETESIYPFVLKYTVEPGTYFYLWGDTHGDIKALSESLYKLHQENVINDDLTIINKNALFFFLGDLIDRGEHGPDTLTLLFMFATKNPRQVFIVRGNHEDVAIAQHYGFFQQLKTFYQQNNQTTYNYSDMQKKIVPFFNLLPVAAFVGCNQNYLQLCHGGFEARYNPKNLIESKNAICFEKINAFKISDHLWNNQYPDTSLENLGIDSEYKNTFKQLWDTEKIPPFNLHTLGFLWNDFTQSNITTYSKNRGIMIGKTLGEKIIAEYSQGESKVKGIIRAHQHNDTMPGIFNIKNRGVYTLWNNQVLTTIGTGIYTGAQSYLKLIVHNNFDDWLLTSYNLDNEVWQERTALLKDWKNAAES